MVQEPSQIETQPPSLVQDFFEEYKLLLRERGGDSTTDKELEDGTSSAVKEIITKEKEITDTTSRYQMLTRTS